MRLSTSEFYQTSINGILNQQQQLNQLQQQLSTGKKVVNPADNPPVAAQLLNLQSAVQTNTQYQQNGNTATSGLNVEQSTLTSVVQSLQSIQTLAIQGNNASQDNTSRKTISNQINQALQQLMTYANTKDPSGNYIFSGSQTNTQPFSQDSNGNYVYNGDSLQQFTQIDYTRQIATNDPGNAVFMNIPNGNGTFTTTAASGNQGTGIISPGSVTNAAQYSTVQGDTFSIQFSSGGHYQVADTTTGTLVSGASGTYSPSGTTIQFDGIQTSISGNPVSGDSFTIKASQSQSIFQTVASLAQIFAKPTSSNQSLTQLHNTVSQDLASLQQGLNHVIDVQAGVGSRLQAIQSQQTEQQNWGTQLQTTQGQLQNVNVAQAVSNYQQQLTSLQAAEQTYVQVEGLSLFKYI